MEAFATFEKEIDALTKTGAWKVAPETVSVYRRAIDTIVENLPEYPDKFQGKGLVMVAGKERYLTCAWVALNIAKRNGFSLPVEVFHLGEKELQPLWRKVFKERFGDQVTFIDARDKARNEFPVRRLNGWECKPFSLLWSSFEEALFIDCDNVVLINPEELFEWAEYKSKGVVFWPDFGRLKQDRMIWEICGVSYKDEPEFESGQIVIDKRRHWKPLILTMWLNEHADFFYEHVHGDKETFHMAWRKLEIEYAMPSQRIHALTCTMCQHNFKGEIVFQHRNMDKWAFSGNIEVAGFQREAECKKLVADLEDLLDEEDTRMAVKLPEIQRIEKDLLKTEVFIYDRIGFDKREIRLGRRGRIKEGQMFRESMWKVQKINDVYAIVFLGEDEEVTCYLTRGADSIWRGRWIGHEKMLVELVPENIYDSGYR